VSQWWVLVECPGGRILRESLEALGAARSVQRAFPGPLAAVWVGVDPQLSHTQTLASLGVERLVRLPAATGPSHIREAFLLAGLRELHDANRPACLLLGATPLARRLAPKLAVLQGAGHLPRVTYLRRVGDRLQFTRSLVHGRVSEILGLAPDTPGVVTLAPGAFPLPRPTTATPPSSTPLRDETHRTAFSLVEPHGWKVLEHTEDPLDELDIEDADVVVAGGKGMGSAGGFCLLRELADLLGGTVAASRIAVDLGWAGKDRLVGQTGRKISPELYIACGISGAPQHRAGLRDCRYLLAINTDPDAPIFRHATWAVVGDALRVLPEWIRLLREEAA